MANVYRHRLVGTDGGGKIFEIVTNWLCNESSGVDPWTIAKHCMNMWDTNIKDSMKQALPSDSTLQYESAQRVTGGGGPEAERAIVEAGLFGGSGTANSSAAILALAPMSPYTKWGRSFIPSIPSTGITGGVLQPGYVAAVQNVGSTYNAGGTDAGDTFTIVIFEKKLKIGHVIIGFDVRFKVGAVGKRERPAEFRH